MALPAHVFDSRRLVPGALVDVQIPKGTEMAPGGEEADSRSVVLQVALNELAVAFEVQQAVAAVVERNDGLLVPLLRLEGEVDRASNRMARLRGVDQPFRLREDFASLEGADLVHRARLDQPRVQQDAEGRGGPVVPEAARMDPRRDEGMAQSVHLHERRHLPGVAEVVFVAALRHRRDGLRLDRDEPRLDLAVEPFADHRIREAREVRATADAADHEVGRVSACSNCFCTSRPMIVWCIRTWFRTLPSEYFVFFPVTAASIASEIAIPRDPGWSGSCARNFFPTLV